MMQIAHPGPNGTESQWKQWLSQVWSGCRVDYLTPVGHKIPLLTDKYAFDVQPLNDQTIDCIGKALLWATLTNRWPGAVILSGMTAFETQRYWIETVAVISQIRRYASFELVTINTQTGDRFPDNTQGI